MAATRCVHCTFALTERDALFVYPTSGAVAHLACVAQPSVAETDRLLVAAATVHEWVLPASEVRRVWSSGVTGTSPA